jgi:hypothetical protein
MAVPLRSQEGIFSNGQDALSILRVTQQATGVKLKRHLFPVHCGGGTKRLKYPGKAASNQRKPASRPDQVPIISAIAKVQMGGDALVTRMRGWGISP